MNDSISFLKVVFKNSCASLSWCCFCFIAPNSFVTKFSMYWHKKKYWYSILLLAIDCRLPTCTDLVLSRFDRQLVLSARARSCVCVCVCVEGGVRVYVRRRAGVFIYVSVCDCALV